MAAFPLIPDDRTVYRGLRNSNWVKRGVVRYLAFMLRPATPQFPEEKELSLGLTPETAIDELREHHGIAGLAVLEIHRLPHGLAVRFDPQNGTKAELFGLPLYSTEPAERNLAMTIAEDLAGLTHFIPPHAIQAQPN